MYKKQSGESNFYAETSFSYSFDALSNGVIKIKLVCECHGFLKGLKYSGLNIQLSLCNRRLTRKSNSEELPQQ